MEDILKPMSLDITKNLHGHVRVETRSRWTGRVVDSQEKDNLVTNAVQQMLMTAMWGSATYTCIPLYSTLLGGIMLFDNTLTESASNISFPSSAKLVGYAGQNANSSNPLGGSYNSAESTKTSNGFTTVWDFLTSQANGTIASLARTSMGVAYGAPYYFNASFDLRPGGFGTSNYLFYLGYDETNKYVFVALGANTTYDGVSYSQNPQVLNQKMR